MQKFSLREPKRHEKKMTGILLGDITGGGPVMSQPSDSSMLVFVF